MRIIFMGTPEAAVASLARCLDEGHDVAAVWTQPDRPAGRGKKLTVSPVKQFAVSKGIPVHQPTKLRNEEAVALFRSYEADISVVVAYGRILPDPFLIAPRFGCVNVHFSLLPQYRGAAPVNWAIVRGEHETGVTTMQMDSGLDTGPVFLQSSTPIGPRETAPELMQRLAVIGADLLSETLRQFCDLESKPQDGGRATFAPILKREDGQIDFVLDAFQIERRVRGFQPWPGAYTLLDGKRLIIWAADGVGEGGLGIRGEVLEANGDRLAVSAGDGTVLRIEELQPEGKRRMSVRDFLNGISLKVGTQLGK
jgi:methionyl-tRNA formyltransferase